MLSISASMFAISFILNLVHFSYIFNQVSSSSLKYCNKIIPFLGLPSKDNTNYSLQIRKLTRVTMLLYSHSWSTPSIVSKLTFISNTESTICKRGVTYYLQVNNKCSIVCGSPHTSHSLLALIRHRLRFLLQGSIPCRTLKLNSFN